MKEKRIDLETAKLAKERGFNKKTSKSWKQPVVTPRGTCDKLAREYRIEKTNDRYSSFTEISYPNEDFPAPTQSLLSKWLRETHNIDVDVTRDPEVHYKDEVRWIVKVSDWNDIKRIKYSIAELKHPNHSHFIDFKSFEEAFEVGLVEGLKMVK